ncbi:MAG: hypothetical protein M0Q49_04640 [Porticoccaceae bacterium]|nr:hypothetical protein [Porticoccaceae bacterium]
MTHPNRLDTYVDLLDLYRQAARVAIAHERQPTKINGALYMSMLYHVIEVVENYINAYRDHLVTLAVDLSHEEYTRIDLMESLAKSSYLECTPGRIELAFESILPPRSTEP